MAESEEELKSLLMKVKEQSEKVGWELNIQKTNIMASVPITSGQIDGDNGNSETLLFGGSKITADGDCSHEIKRRLLLGRKAVTNLESILKSRDTTLTTKVQTTKLWFFQTSCMDMRVKTTKKAEHWRIDAFELWCWRRLLRVSWTARRSNSPS